MISTAVPITSIETVSGKLVDLANPKYEDFTIQDIAWGLSREPRFGGHTITELVYSVGQHSIQVSKIIQAIFERGSIRDAFFSHDLSKSASVQDLMSCHRPEALDRGAPKWLMMFGLLHDASEAYLRDLPSPVKALPGLKEAYLAVEKKIMNVILVKYCVPAVEGNDFEAGQSIVHWADLYARTVEAYHFMPSRGAHWHSHQKVSLVDLQRFELPKKSIVVYQEFLDQFEWLDSTED